VWLLATNSIVQHASRDQAGQHRYLRGVRPNGSKRVGVHDDEAIVGVALEARDAEQTSTACSAHQRHTIWHTHHVVLHHIHVHWLVAAALRNSRYWSGIGWLASGGTAWLLSRWLVTARRLATGWE